MCKTGMKRIKNLISVLAVVLGLLTLTLFSSYATTQINTSRSCSLTVIVQYNNQGVSGGAVSIYLVGTVSSASDYTFVLTDDYSSFSSEQEYSGSDAYSETLAESLYSYIQSNSISATSTKTCYSSGVLFSDLSVGMYLVVQSGECDGYESFAPFIVTLPYLEDGSYSYSLTAYGKITPITSEDEEDTTNSDDTDDGPDTGSDDDSDDHGDSTGDGSGDGSDYSEQTTSSDDTDTDDTGTGSGGGSDDSEQTTSSDDTDTEDTDTGSGGGSDDSEETTDGDSGSGSSDTSKLPQTGQLNWPVPVMSSLGVILLIWGLCLRIRNRKHSASDE